MKHTIEVRGIVAKLLHVWGKWDRVNYHGPLGPQ